MSARTSMSGQVAVIALLLMSVILVVVLSVVSRSIEDISLSSRDDQSARALSAAEAGVEAFLSSNVDQYTFGDPSVGIASEFNVAVSGYGGGVSSYTYPRKLGSGETATFWFVDHDDDGNITCSSGNCINATGSIEICWNNTNPQTAIEYQLFYDDTRNAVSNGDYSGIKVRISAVDGYAARRANNNFRPTDSGNCGSLGAVRSTISALNSNAICDNENPGCLLALVVKPLYTSTTDVNQKAQIAVSLRNNPVNLPKQAVLVESIGKSYSDAQVAATRKLEVIQPFPELPPIFAGAMFSMTDIVKN